eukprot:TRINITY_DN4738_c0_g1_i1.p1 TRINITY_DN4738_c0_g1~~TRINITY_DN4738_c0_g1_i1.p1  ORF type:complete len:116 (+),score=20.26 TRINITY_DN4738_c0_g1_i1:152-499(+)
MIRRPPRSTHCISSAASDVYKRQVRDYMYTVTLSDEQLYQILDLMTAVTPITYKILPRQKLPDGTFSKQKIIIQKRQQSQIQPVSYTHLRAHETRHDLVCRLLLEKKKPSEIQAA